MDTNLEVSMQISGFWYRNGCEFGCSQNTAIVKTDNQQGPTVEHRELYSVLYNNLNRERIWKKKKQIYVYV